MEAIRENLSEDVRNQQIYLRVCELIQTPEYLSGLVARYTSCTCVDAETLKSVAEAVLSDDERVIRRDLINAIIETIWQLAEYELEASQTGIYH